MVNSSEVQTDESSFNVSDDAPQPNAQGGVNLAESIPEVQQFPKQAGNSVLMDITAVTAAPQAPEPDGPVVDLTRNDSSWQET